MDILIRPQWGAQLALGPPIRLPAQGIHVHHTVTTPTGDVAADMRQLERIGGQRFGRFSYSWCLHPTGVVGEGAGLTVGAHTGGYNSTSFGIALIGNYELNQPTDAQIEAFAQLRRRLVDVGHLDGHYVLPHRSRTDTACPGRHTMARWADLIAPPQEDILATVDEMTAAMRAVLNEGTGAGQASWAGTNKALLATVQGNTNLLRAIQAGQLTVDDVVDALVERLPDLQITRDTLRGALVDALVELAARPAG